MLRSNNGYGVIRVITVMVFQSDNGHGVIYKSDIAHGATE